MSKKSRGSKECHLNSAKSVKIAKSVKRVSSVSKECQKSVKRVPKECQVLLMIHDFLMQNLDMHHYAAAVE